MVFLSSMNPIRTFQNITPHCGERVFVDSLSAVIGDVTLGEDVSIWPCAVLRGDLLPIVIGARSNIQDGAVLHTTHKSRFNPTGFGLTIGADVTVGHRATLHGCTICNEALIGMNATVLDGAIVESQSLVAAGSVVAPGTIVTQGWLWAGIPAKPKRVLTTAELEYFLYSAQNYVKLKDLHLANAS